MIPRYQRILFWTLVGCIVLMTLFLLRGCQQAHRRLTAVDTLAPIAAPTSSSTEGFAFYLADDSDGSITVATRQLALPQELTLRARTLLEHLFTEYTDPKSTHPLQTGPAIDDVFFLNPPDASDIASDTTSAKSSAPASAKLAIVNLHGAFVEHHPSGIEIEDLTLRSIIGTLHAAFPQLTQIRFVVNGQPRDTLAGHADLTHPYTAEDTAFKPIVPNSGDNAGTDAPKPGTQQTTHP